MTVKEAIELVSNKYSDMAVIECFELPDFYAFGMIDKGREGEAVGGGYITVSKIDGTQSAISSVEIALADAIKKIDIDNF